MAGKVRHVAITVPDLEQAEEYYAALLEMEVITREAPGPEGGLQLPHDKGWADARAAGIDLYMLALRRGHFVLVLFDENAPTVKVRGVPARPLIVGLEVTRPEVAQVCARLHETPAGGQHAQGRCQFKDRYGITWQLKSEGEFLGNGDGAGRWLEL